jgi:hypothetical protein
LNKKKKKNGLGGDDVVRNPKKKIIKKKRNEEEEERCKYSIRRKRIRTAAATQQVFLSISFPPTHSDGHVRGGQGRSRNGKKEREKPSGHSTISFFLFSVCCLTVSYFPTKGSATQTEH